MASYTSKVIAVLGRTVRAGRWKLAEDSLVIAVFGRCALDLSRSFVDEEDDDLTMTIFSLFGSVSVLLPPGCDVEPSGVAIMSWSDVEIPSEQPADITAAALAPLDISFFALFSKVRVAEVRGADSVLTAGSAAVATGLAPEGSLAPPSVEVFGGGPDTVENEPAPLEDATVESAPAETTAAFDDPDAQAAALRDEIAQWRAESGRSASTPDDAEADGAVPADEIIDEPVDTTVDAAAG